MRFGFERHRDSGVSGIDLLSAIVTRCMSRYGASECFGFVILGDFISVARFPPHMGSH